MDLPNCVIEFTNVSKSFKKDFWSKPNMVLNSVSFNVLRGSVTALMGVNGAGKTTALKILLGLTKADSGFSSINFNHDIPKKWTSFLPERPYLYPNMKGKDFLLYMAGLHELTNNKAKEKIEYWSSRLSINHALEKKIKEYSKGMLQRLGMVSCLISSSKLLILDEPLSGLDPIGRIEFKNIFRELNLKHGTTIFFTTHVVSDVEELCSHLVVLRDSKIQYSGSLENLNNLIAGETKYYITYEFNSLVSKELINGEDKDMIINKLINQGANVTSLTPELSKVEKFVYQGV